MTWEREIRGYPVRKEGPVLDAEAVATLQAVLLNPHSFILARKDCSFSPEVVFEFHRGEETRPIMLDFGCDCLSLDRHLYFEPSRATLVRLAHELFPGDPFVSSLFPQSYDPERFRIRWPSGREARPEDWY